MLAWVLVLAVVGEAQGVKSLQPISTFETRELCEAAGRDIETRFTGGHSDLLIYTCVERGGQGSPLAASQD